MSSGRLNGIASDFFLLLDKLSTRLQAAETEDELLAIIADLEAIPPVVRKWLGGPSNLADVQTQMARANERMEKIIRQPSISTLPPAGRHFREASTKLSHIGRRTK